MKIDYDKITQAAQRRRETLERLQENLPALTRALYDLHQVLDRLNLVRGIYFDLDEEGKELLPVAVRAQLAMLPEILTHLDSAFLTAPAKHCVYGLSELVQAIKEASDDNLKGEAK